MPLRMVAYSAPYPLPADSREQAEVCAKTAGYSDCFRAYNHENFKDRCDLPEGWYGAEPIEQFEVGYSSYYWIRERLAKLAGAELVNVWQQKQRFVQLYELLDFPDSAGVLGFQVCSKLSSDLYDLADDAKAQLPSDVYAAYQGIFRVVFAAACHGGVVVFR